MLHRLFKGRRNASTSQEEFRDIFGGDTLLDHIRRGSGPISLEGITAASDEELLDKLSGDKSVGEEILYRELADYLQIEYSPREEITYSNEEISLLKRFDRRTLEYYGIILVGRRSHEVVVGLSTSRYFEARDIMKSILSEYQVRICVISRSFFRELYEAYLGKLSIEDEVDSIDFKNLDAISGSADDLTNEDSPIVKLVNNILREAVRNRSSDIHIEPYTGKTIIRNRIDGVLIENTTKIPQSYHESVISRIKIMGKLNIAEQRVPQDGRIKKDIEGKLVDFRISILPTVHGESCVIRILDRKKDVLLLRSLGASQEEREEILRGAQLPYGMILVTGPTGSGKTTTLYAILNEIRDREKKVITIEDPVEYQLDNAVQIPVNEKAGLTFAKGLRSILRQDPDKIMVGEIRDRETAEIAVQAALTGHLVVSTLHANNTVEAIGRLANIGIDSYQFATALNLVVGQRLMRRRCSHCLGNGCRECNDTGYLGRTGVYEIFSPTEEIKDMIIEGESPLRIKKSAADEGMVLLEEKAFKKVRSGITTREEYERVIGGWEYDEDTGGK